MWALADRVGARGGDSHEIFELRLKIIACLMKLGRYEFAKSQTEEILSSQDLAESVRVRTLHLFATACFRLQLSQVALLAVDECQRGASHVGGTGRFVADVLTLRGNIYQDTGRPEDALDAYEKALEIYAVAGISYNVLLVRLNIAVAQTECGRFDLARELLDSLLLALEAGQHERLRALTLCTLALVHFKSGRIENAEGAALKSNAIARPREYHVIVFRNCYYLWRIAQARDDVGSIRLNERTLRSYLPRVETSIPELEEFRRITAGDLS